MKRIEQNLNPMCNQLWINKLGYSIFAYTVSLQFNLIPFYFTLQSQQQQAMPLQFLLINYMHIYIFLSQLFLLFLLYILLLSLFHSGLPLAKATQHKRYKNIFIPQNVILIWNIHGNPRLKLNTWQHSM